MSSTQSAQLCRLFSLEEILSATNNFDDSLIIGKGGFGKVYKGFIDNGGSTVAMKRLNPLSKQGAPEFWAEINMLSRFRHIHLVSLIGYCNDSTEMVLVYEYMVHGTLADHLYKINKTSNNITTPLSWVKRLKICIGAARGLDYLHTGTAICQRVIHRDVKSSNILLDENWAAKISDFGLSRIGPADQDCTHVTTKHITGTFGYMDPEYFLTRRFTRKSDIYAFGVVLLEVLCERPALDKSLLDEGGLAGWGQECIKEGVSHQLIGPNLKYEIFPDSLKEFLQIVDECLHSRQKKRPSMSVVVAKLENALALQLRTNISMDDNLFDIYCPFGSDECIDSHVEENTVAQSKNDSCHNNTLANKDGGLIQDVPTTRIAQIMTPNLKTYLPSKVGIGKAVAIKRLGKSSMQGPAEGMLQPIMTTKNSESSNLLKKFYIPDYILIPNSKTENVRVELPYPILVFVNSKSGGQLGGELLVTYRSLLNKNQVFDLGDEAPDSVLHRLYFNLERLKLDGDELASMIYDRLRIIVAGGDGIAGWMLGVVSDLKLAQPPPIATMPLGTENNLPFAFGWGKKNPGFDSTSVLTFLDKVANAKEMTIDSWHLLMRMRAPREGACEPIAPLDLPHSMHSFHRASSSDTLNVEGCHTYRGGFWNYFSMGIDAQVSYSFHSERKLHPERFKNQFLNQGTYAKLGLTQGWLTSSLFRPSRNIAHLVKVKIMKKHGEWQDLDIPPSIKSILCLNLPSFSGGLNPWGTPNRRKHRYNDLTPLYVDDGKLEIVGFRDAWHGLDLLTPNGHGTRLAQANRIKFEFQRGAADHTYMRIDGEPWKQPLPVDDTVVVEISHLGQVKMLAAHGCKSKSMHDSSTNLAHEEDGEEDSNEDEDDSSAEERRKFGAADTFKIPEGFDMSRLS